jgi:hypothetical protein
VLALKLQGADLGKEPYKALSEESEKLVKARKNPQALRKELERLGNGDADAGLEALSRMVMAAVPETAGMFAPEMATGEHAAGRADGRAMRGRILRERELERQRERTLALEGPMSARAENAAELQDVEAELAGLRREKARRDRLGSRYVRQDWPKAEALEAEAEQIAARLAQLDHLGIGGGAERGKLEARRAEIARELDAYNQSFKAAGGNKPTADDARLANRIAALEEEKGLRERADSVLERAVIDEETALGRMRPFEDGVTPFGNNPPIVAKPGTTLRASLLGGEAEIEIR